MDITIPTQFADHAQITVFGVGGAGGNALEHMISNKLTDVTFVCANTDAQALNRSSAEHKIQLDRSLQKVSVQAPNLKSDKKPQKRACRKLRNICKIPTWSSLLPAWAAEQVPEQPQSLQKWRKKKIS